MVVRGSFLVADKLADKLGGAHADSCANGSEQAFRSSNGSHAYVRERKPLAPFSMVGNVVVGGVSEGGKVVEITTRTSLSLCKP